MKKIEITVQTSKKINNSEGIVESAWVNVGTLRGTMFPEDNSIEQTGTGWQAKKEYRFIYKGSSTLLIKGNRIITPDKEILYIIKALNYGKAVDVHISLNIPGGGSIV